MQEKGAKEQSKKHAVSGSRVLLSFLKPTCGDRASDGRQQQQPYLSSIYVLQLRSICREHSLQAELAPSKAMLFSHRTLSTSPFLHREEKRPCVATRRLCGLSRRRPVSLDRDPQTILTVGMASNLPLAHGALDTSAASTVTLTLFVKMTKGCFTEQARQHQPPRETYVQDSSHGGDIEPAYRKFASSLCRWGVPGDKLRVLGSRVRRQISIRNRQRVREEVGRRGRTSEAEAKSPEAVSR